MKKLAMSGSGCVGSLVIVGSSAKVGQWLGRDNVSLNRNYDFFSQEAALQDIMRHTRVVVGGNNEDTKRQVTALCANIAESGNADIVDLVCGLRLDLWFGGLFLKPESAWARKYVPRGTRASVTIASWVIALKIKTDSDGNAPTVIFISIPHSPVARLLFYDSGARIVNQNRCKDRINVVIDGRDSLCTVPTERPEFSIASSHGFKHELLQSVLVDGQNVLNPFHSNDISFEYGGVGRT